MAKRKKKLKLEFFLTGTFTIAQFVRERTRGASWMCKMVSISGPALTVWYHDGRMSPTCLHIFVQFHLICDGGKVIQYFSKCYVFLKSYYFNVILFKSHFNIVFIWENLVYPSVWSNFHL